MFDVVSRLTEIEKNTPIIYSIKKESLGPSVVHRDIFSNIDRFRKCVEDFINYYMRDKALAPTEKTTYDNCDIDIVTHDEIHNYYNIVIVRQKNKPVPTKNQFVISMMMCRSALKRDSVTDRKQIKR